MIRFISLLLLMMVMAGCAIGDESRKVTLMGPRAKFTQKF